MASERAGGRKKIPPLNCYSLVLKRSMGNYHDMSSEVTTNPVGNGAAYNDPTYNDPGGIHYELLGTDGPTLVLLHGWMHSLEDLRQLGENLSGSYRVILVDIPGFGRSPLPPAASDDGGGWGTPEFAKAVHELLLKLGVEQCTLIGHSLGGRVSVRLAATYPEAVTALVLIGTPGLPYNRPLKQELRSRWIKGLVSVAKRIDSLTGSRFFPHYLAPRFGSRDYQAAGKLRKTLVKLVNEDLTSQASTIKAPALLLWGEDDAQAPVAIGYRYQQLLQGSKLVVLPARGHEPFRDVGSHLLATHIEHFLSEIGVGGAK
jgi:pimeloyl-ACP methyl ester carboxylesterase